MSTAMDLFGGMGLRLTRSGHVEPSSLRKQHTRTFVAKQASKDNLRPVHPFVLYRLRRTFLTQLGESGCDAWTLARIAGHSTISISSRYVPFRRYRSRSHVRAG